MKVCQMDTGWSAKNDLEKTIFKKNFLEINNGEIQGVEKILKQRDIHKQK